MISDLVEVYCLSDNLTKKIDDYFKKSKIGRKSLLNRAEYITLAIIKQKRGISTNKDLYEMVKLCMQKDFSNLPSYQQFCKGLEENFKYVALIAQILASMNKSHIEGEYFIDSSALEMCKSIYNNDVKLGNGIADLGKNLEGWFFGFKLHLIITKNMEIVSFKFSTASTSDIAALDDKFVHGLKGYLIGDKGYISFHKARHFSKKGLTLISRGRKNMKKTPINKYILSLLAKRQRIETVFGQLKNTFSLINRKLRSVKSFFSNACSALISYMIKQKPELLSLDYYNFDMLSIS